MTDFDADVVVIGGGPIGLATAIEARLAHLSVVLIEPRDTPVDKACGEGLMPAARAGLRRLGVEPAGRQFHGIRYLAPGRSATALFEAGPGLGVRRTTLSQALASRAAELGVELIRAKAEPPVLNERGARVGDVRARWLVAADGLHSPTRHRLGLDVAAPRRVPAARYGLRRHFRCAPWSDLVEVHWAADAEAYVTPVAQDLVGVAILCPGGEPFDGWLQRFPELVERLRQGHAEPVGPVRGAGPLRQRSRRRVAGPALLVGDAAGYVDALTGEGISVGLSCARELVGCLAAGRPQAYPQAWRRATRRYRLLTGGLLWVAGRPVLRRTIVPLAQRLPPVFTAMVNQLG